MKRSVPVILLLTVLLLSIAVVFGRNEIGMRNFPFSVVVASDGGQQELSCMKLGGEFYMFLPSYAEGDAARICTNPIYDVYIEGQKLTQNQSCADFPANTKLELRFQSLGNEGHETITFVRSGNVATMYIDVPSGNMDYIHAEKGNAEAASVQLYTVDGRLDYDGAARSVKGRGNATWEEAEKKPYSLKLLHEADLLGLGNAQNWVLLSNVWDASNIRNKIAYDTAAAAGMPFSPECNWVDLYLNGEYAGLYLLSERNEIHPERVDISKESGFLVSLEFHYRLVEQDYSHIDTERGLALRIHDSSMPASELQALWQSVENAILSEDGIDPVTGKHWEELIDLDSWAHKYLLEELFGNYDAGSVSQYFYCDLTEPEAKIHAGPIWDFDSSMGRGGWQVEDPRAFAANREHYFDSNDHPLFYGLYRHQKFHDRIAELFISVYEPLLRELTDGKIQEYAQQVSLASKANQIRCYTGDAQTAAEKITSYLTERTNVFDDLWVKEASYCTVEFMSDSDPWGCLLVPTGEYIMQLPTKGNWVWYDEETGEPFDVTRPIVTDVRLVAVTE